MPEVNFGQQKSKRKSPGKGFSFASTSYIFRLLVTSTSNIIIADWEMRSMCLGQFREILFSEMLWAGLPECSGKGFDTFGGHVEKVVDVFSLHESIELMYN